MNEIPGKLPRQKGIVRKGSSSDLVPYMVEYINHLRDIVKQAKTIPKNTPSTPSPTVRPDDFFRSQITIRPIPNSGK